MAKREAEAEAVVEEAAEAPAVKSEYTESEWALVNTRRSQEDAKHLFDAVAAGESISIVPDPEPEEEEASAEEPAEEE
jgi:hypothetical protein